MKLKYIDTLRGLAVLAVLMVHCSQIGDVDLIPSKLLRFFSFGDKGVQLFFIASAFTLFLSLHRRSESSSRNFFIRRFFRIAPMYYIAILYYLFQNGLGARYWLGDESGISISNILSNITFSHGFNPYWINSLVPGGWTIGIEMMFYCLVPFLFKRIKCLDQAFGFFIITLFIRFVFNYLILKNQLITSDYIWEAFLYFYLPNQLPVFALGILLYYIIYGAGNYKRSAMNYYFFALLIFAQLLGYDVFQNHIVFGIAFLFLGIALHKYEFKLLVNPIFIYIGKISYSMYLVHFAVLYWMNKFELITFIGKDSSMLQTGNMIIRFAILITITILISSIFYRFIEVPSQRLGKLLIKRFTV